MALTLSEKEKKALVSIINERLDEHLSRYPYFRYPTEPLEDWRRVFCEPKAVLAETLKLALGWHFGGWQRKDLSLIHRKTIAEAVTAWAEFAKSDAHQPQQALAFWQSKLTDWQHGFGAAAFLLHLQQPDTFEIVDRHRLDAMFELLKTIGHAEKDQPAELSFASLQD